MKALVHLSIDIFPIIMLLIIWINNHRKMEKSKASGYFERLTLITVLSMTVDIAGNLAAEISTASPDPVLWAFFVARLLLSAGLAATWLCYVAYRLCDDYQKRRTEYIVWFAHGVFAASVIGVLLAPWEDLAHYGNGNETVEMIVFYRIISVENMALLLISIAIAVLAYRRREIREKRIECLHMMWFGLIPLFSVLLENYFREWKMTGAAIAIAILYIYVNAQDRQITTDSLTGLNNRREFDLYLRRLIEQGVSGWGMLMIDMDDFKQINDNLGHVTGDEALWETADILRRRLGKEKTFLARYGGDEFVVVDMWENESRIHEVIQEIEDEIDIFNECGKKEYRLSVSIGHALWNENPGSVEKLIELADGRMYEIKQAKKKERRKVERSGLFTN